MAGIGGIQTVAKVQVKTNGNTVRLCTSDGVQYKLVSFSVMILYKCSRLNSYHKTLLISASQIKRPPSNQ
ncbi:hypothetical protein VTN49DRAFT_4439 [Thermomyces lanuginosus]|uniref:uncharacterized protein n=1 Tax=Thermomyces lanuginosus TaxID=5541 RepID=UPI003742D1C9